MDQPVNFDNLREITGGDLALESELFRNFIASSAACLEGLRGAMAGGDEGEWRKHAHALKGVCLNLGADALGGLCKKAQEDYRATGEEKRLILCDIEGELARVQAALEPHL